MSGGHKPDRRWMRGASALLLALFLLIALPVPDAAASPSAPVGVAQPPPVPPSPSPPPPPPPPCQAELTALQSNQQRIAAHNARPHVFTPQQAPQRAAYDAEAAQLNAEQRSATANLQACRTDLARAQTLKRLETAGTRDPPIRSRLLPDTRRQIEQARAQIPQDWQEPPLGTITRRWDVPDEIRPFYEAVRRGTPGKVTQYTLRGEPRPKIGDPDPAFADGRRIRANGEAPDVQADHIVSVAQIVQLPGFHRLRDIEDMRAILNAPINLQWLSRDANRMKSSGSAMLVQGADGAWVLHQLRLQIEVRAQLVAIIQDLLALDAEGP